MISPKDNPDYMSYSTWHELNTFFEDELLKLKTSYLIACSLINYQSYDPSKSDTLNYKPGKNAKVALEELYNGYLTSFKRVSHMQRQLKYAFSKGAHPNVIKNGFFKK